MTYFTVVLDNEKFTRWIDARKSNGAKINMAEISRMIGYGQAYLSQLMSGKYDIEVSGRFVGTFLKTFGLQFDEIFKVVRINEGENPKPSDWYLSAKNRRRSTALQTA